MPRSAPGFVDPGPPPANVDEDIGRRRAASPRVGRAEATRDDHCEPLSGRPAGGPTPAGHREVGGRDERLGSRAGSGPVSLEAHNAKPRRRSRRGAITAEKLGKDRGTPTRPGPGHPRTSPSSFVEPKPVLDRPEDAMGVVKPVAPRNWRTTVDGGARGMRAGPGDRAVLRGRGRRGRSPHRSPSRTRSKASRRPQRNLRERSGRPSRSPATRASAPNRITADRPGASRSSSSQTDARARSRRGIFDVGSQPPRRAARQLPLAATDSSPVTRRAGAGSAENPLRAPRGAASTCPTPGSAADEHERWAGTEPRRPSHNGSSSGTTRSRIRSASSATDGPTRAQWRSGRGTRSRGPRSVRVGTGLGGPSSPNSAQPWNSARASGRGPPSPHSEQHHAGTACRSRH